MKNKIVPNQFKMGLWGGEKNLMIDARVKILVPYNGLILFFFAVGRHSI